MRCKSPFFHKRLQVQLPCGKCIFCRINRRNKWAARLILEKSLHAQACYVTLTYDDASLPSPPSVSKREMQLFLKRLRKAIEPQRIRYYAVGEYGDQFLRPHYHLIIFGLPPNPQVKKLIHDVWGKGHTKVDACENACMRYVAGYVAKKYTSDKADRIGKELEKEFALMSRRPALGSEALKLFVDDAFVQNPYDVLTIFRSQKRNFPFDRLMREKLRKLVMSEDEIEHIKELRIGVMREELEELIFEELGEFKLKCFKDGVWQRDIVKEAHSSRYSKTLAQEERIFLRRTKRKDL